MGPTPYQVDKWNCQTFINIKKYEIVFKIRKDHVRKVFFLMVINDLCLKQVHKYARLKKQ